MSSVKITQIKCPNCGSQINSVNAFSQTRTCAYCKTEFNITGTMDKEMETPERIIPFMTVKDDFESSVLNFIVNDPLTPDDIFDMISFDDTEGVYLPMFLYEGKYECTWNCSVGYQGSEVCVEKDLSGKTYINNKKVIQYTPMSGSNKGNFAFVCTAYEGNEVKPELSEYARTLTYSAEYAKAFEPQILEDQNFLLHNLDKETIWSKFGNGAVKLIAENESIKSVPGDTFKDFRASVVAEPSHTGRLVFVPFWSIYYNYKGEKYFALMNGINKNSVTGSVPVDIERQNKIKKLEKRPKKVLIAAFISLITMFFSPALSALIFCMLLLAFGIVKLRCNSKIQKIKEKSLILRHSRLNAILKRDK